VARLIWTEPVLADLDEIADYIALDNPAAARRLVQRVFKSVERLQRFPSSGKRPTELPRTSYRELVVTPCCVFYRVDGDDVFLLSVMRAVLNRALRRSLGKRQTDQTSRPYRLPAFSMGAVRIPGQNLDKALALADLLEDDEAARKLEMRK
jgi:toxin ParE1/3/4